jgi:hypothetical protein
MSAAPASSTTQGAQASATAATSNIPCKLSVTINDAVLPTLQSGPYTLKVGTIDGVDGFDEDITILTALKSDGKQPSM